MENTLQLVALLRVLFLFPGPMTAVHCRSGPARLDRFYDLFISEVSLFSWNELSTELERPRYQTGYHRYQGNGFKPNYGGYRQGWGSKPKVHSQDLR